MPYVKRNENGDITGWVSQPADGYTEFVEGPVQTLQETLNADKEAKEEQIAKLTVTTASGKVFDADRAARDAMTTAIAVGDPGMTHPWKLADNSVATVTYEELKEALLLVGHAHTAIVTGVVVP